MLFNKVKFMLVPSIATPVQYTRFKCENFHSLECNDIAYGLVWTISMEFCKIET